MNQVRIICTAYTSGTIVVACRNSIAAHFIVVEDVNTTPAITASGNVRFIGFGAEGTCSELTVSTHSGEVTLDGSVKVQVKDKFGRVESELSSDKMNYRLDATHPLTGTLEP